MSKVIWGGIGAVVVLAATGVGAKIYADKSLAAYYAQPHHHQNNYQLSYANYNMGAMSGSADIKLRVLRDPCDANSTMQFSGQDRIERTWQGYVIHSQLALENKQHKDAQYFQQPINIQTVINWAGMIKTNLQLPKMQLKEQKLSVDIEPIGIQIDGQMKPEGMQFKKMQLHIPRIFAGDHNAGMQLQNMRLETNYSSMVELVPGTLQWHADRIEFNLKDRDGAAMSLDRIDLTTDTILNKHSVDILSKFKVGQMNIPNARYENAEFNFDFKELNRGQLENYYRIFAQKDQSCAAAKKFDQDLEVALFQLLNAGFVFESLNNKVETNQGALHANLSSKIMPNYVNSKESLVKMFPSLIDAKMDLSLDKNVLKSFLQLAPNRRTPINDTEVDMLLKTMEEQGRIQRNGNTIKMGMQYQYGKPTFNQYH